MKYQFYTTSAHAWRAMLTAIKGAKKSIYWESYIFQEDVKRPVFVNALKRKAEAGVVVKIIVDSFGSFFLKKSVIKELERAGAEVLFYNRLIPWWNVTKFKYWWFHRNHKKLLIVDEKTAFIGGVNLAKKMKNWIDLQVELQGAAVRYLLKSFVSSYKLSGGRDEIKYPLLFKKGEVRVFHHSPLTEKSILKKYYKESLKTAKKTIVIVTPYFFPQSWLIKSLRRAIKRGVKIEVILPSQSDYRTADLASYYLASLIYRPGIKFFFIKKMNHAKVLMIDDKEAMVGSQNIDAMSFDYNLEGGVVFREKDMIKQLKIIIDKWKKDSRELVFDNNKRKWYQRLIMATILWLTPYI